MMIRADLHLHTCFSHGQATPFEMHRQAEAAGFSLIGFSEHSPRPAGYDYSNEYRERLAAHLDDYCRQVLALKKNAATGPGNCQVLLGMEIDWFSGERDFVRRASRSLNFDYLLGSVHFLGHWGFDDRQADWEGLSQEECGRIYTEYFRNWREMLESGFFQIAAHPDLVKIFSKERFHVWLDEPESRRLVRDGLAALKNSGMAMEVSSAGLRKPCAEVYPAPAIMQMAAEMEIPVALASDAHRAQDFASGFADLEKYAKSFGYEKQAVFEKGRISFLPF